MDTLQASPITPRDIRRWTEQDPILSKVQKYVLQGWTSVEENELKPYQRRKEELSLQDGCLLWGCRVVVPKKGQAKVLEQLHQGHPGMARMKGLARGIVGIDNYIASKIQTMSTEPKRTSKGSTATMAMATATMVSNIHIDHAGPFMGKMFLVVVDAHSKWLDVVVVPSTSSNITIQKLRMIFATHGLPDTLVSDNTAGFIGVEFKQFLQRNGIRHITSAPYQPATNGLAERAVKTLKEGLRKCTEGDMETRLARFLFHYRNTPQHYWSYTCTAVAQARAKVTS